MNAELLFTADLHGTFNELEGELKTWNVHHINIHPEIIIEPEEVVDVYANKHPRRLQLL